MRSVESEALSVALAWSYANLFRQYATNQVIFATPFFLTASVENSSDNKTHLNRPDFLSRSAALVGPTRR